MPLDTSPSLLATDRLASSSAMVSLMASLLIRAVGVSVAAALVALGSALFFSL